jgi:hypothetical protein
VRGTWEGKRGRVAGGWRIMDNVKYCDMLSSNIIMGETCSTYGGIGMY